MHFNLLLPSLIRADWERIGTRLAPAVEVDETRQLDDVERDLLNGDMALFDIELEHVDLLTVVEFADDGSCLLLYAAGRIGGIGREWIGRARMLVTLLEQLARRNGCTELRIEGRDWSRVLPGYRRAGGRNELVGAL